MMLNKKFGLAVKRLGCLLIAIAAALTLTSCADDGSLAATVPAKKPTPKYTVLVSGGNNTIQAWTAQAINRFCINKGWPANISRVRHLPLANHPSFNQPRKTQVVVAPDNALHVHFQLGGVLMDNYSHELIIRPPKLTSCQMNVPQHYAVTMQPDGDAVIYLSKPLSN